MRFPLLALLVLVGLARAPSAAAQSPGADGVAVIAGEVLRVFLDHEDGHDENDDSCFDCVQCSSGDGPGTSACGSSDDDERMMTYAALCAGAGLAVVIAWQLFGKDRCGGLAPEETAAPPRDAPPLVQVTPLPAGVELVDDPTEADIVVTVRRANVARLGVGYAADRPSAEAFTLQARDARTGRPLLLPDGALLTPTLDVPPGEADEALARLLAALAARSG